MPPLGCRYLSIWQDCPQPSIREKFPSPSIHAGAACNSRRRGSYYKPDESSNPRGAIVERCHSESYGVNRRCGRVCQLSALSPPSQWTTCDCRLQFLSSYSLLLLCHRSSEVVFVSHLSVAIGTSVHASPLSRAQPPASDAYS
jgi:hypothetical protein